jgi:hypothetical protein
MVDAHTLELRDRSARAVARRHPRVASVVPWLAVLAAGGMLFGDPTWLIFALLLEPFAIGYLVFAWKEDRLVLSDSGVTDQQAHLTRQWNWDEVAAIGAGTSWISWPGVPLQVCRFGQSRPLRIGGFRPRRVDAESVLQEIAAAGWPIFVGSPSWDWSLDQRSKGAQAD